MAADSVEIARIVLIGVVLIGYIPIVVAHLRHGTRWMLSAYTALVATAAVLLFGELFNLPDLSLFIRFGVAVAAILFMITAHKSEQKIMTLADKAEKGKIPLGEGDTQ